MNWKALHWIVNLFFLSLIFLLWLTGNIKVWMILIIVSLVSVPFLGRIYCGWICPVFTSLKLWKKAGGKSAIGKYSGIMEKKWLEILVFTGLAALFIILNILESPIPPFIALIPIALVFVYFFGEVKWHRLCPFGVGFTLLNSLFKKGAPKLEDRCISCGTCIELCPGGALLLNDVNIRVNAKYCLSCGECQEICPVYKSKN